MTFPTSDPWAPPPADIGSFQIIEPEKSSVVGFNGEDSFNPFNDGENDLENNDGDFHDSKAKKKSKDGKESSERKSSSKRDKMKRSSSRSDLGKSKSSGEDDRKGRSKSPNRDHDRTKLNSSRSRDKSHDRDDHIGRSRHRDEALTKSSHRGKGSSRDRDQDRPPPSRKLERHQSERKIEKKQSERKLEKKQNEHRSEKSPNDRVKEKNVEAEPGCIRAVQITTRKTDLNKLVRNGSIRNLSETRKSSSSRNLLGTTTSLDSHGDDVLLKQSNSDLLGAHMRKHRKKGGSDLCSASVVSEGFGARERGKSLLNKKSDSALGSRPEDESESDTDEDEHLKRIRERQARIRQRGPAEVGRDRSLSRSRELSRGASLRSLSTSLNKSNSTRSLLDNANKNDKNGAFGLAASIHRSNSSRSLLDSSIKNDKSSALGNRGLNSSLNKSNSSRSLLDSANKYDKTIGNALENKSSTLEEEERRRQREEWKAKRGKRSNSSSKLSAELDSEYDSGKSSKRLGDSWRSDEDRNSTASKSSNRSKSKGDNDRKKSSTKSGKHGDPATSSSKRSNRRQSKDDRDNEKRSSRDKKHEDSESEDDPSFSSDSDSASFDSSYSNSSSADSDSDSSSSSDPEDDLNQTRNFLSFLKTGLVTGVTGKKITATHEKPVAEIAKSKVTGGISRVMGAFNRYKSAQKGMSQEEDLDMSLNLDVTESEFNHKDDSNSDEEMSTDVSEEVVQEVKKEKKHKKEERSGKDHKHKKSKSRSGSDGERETHGSRDRKRREKDSKSNGRSRSADTIQNHIDAAGRSLQKDLEKRSKERNTVGSEEEEPASRFSRNKRGQGGRRRDFGASLQQNGSEQRNAQAGDEWEDDDVFAFNPTPNTRSNGMSNAADVFTIESKTLKRSAGSRRAQSMAVSNLKSSGSRDKDIDVWNESKSRSSKNTTRRSYSMAQKDGCKTTKGLDPDVKKRRAVARSRASVM